MAVTRRYEVTVNDLQPYIRITLTDMAGALIDLTGATIYCTMVDNAVVSKPATITRSGTTATVTATAHGYASGSYVRIAGADQAAYNGAFAISNVTANTFDYTVSGSPTTPATGTITASAIKIYRQTAGIVIADQTTAKGQFDYRWVSGDTNTAGVYRLELEVNPVSGGKYTIPRAAEGPLYVYISSGLDAS